MKLITGSYLYKDILMLEQVKKPVLLEKILKAPALKLGSEVNYHELSQIVEADKGTVEKYIDLLERAYVVFRLPDLNRNVRSELKKGKKKYISTTVALGMQFWVTIITLSIVQIQVPYWKIL